MDLENFFKALSAKKEKRKELEWEFNAMCAQLSKEEKELEEQYIKDNAKFKVGDVVRYANSPKGKHFIVKDVVIVTYNVCHPLSQYSQADIRYGVETKNGWKPNGGWHISEYQLAKVE